MIYRYAGKMLWGGADQAAEDPYEMAPIAKTQVGCHLDRRELVLLCIRRACSMRFLMRN
jgi:hypothetical protein